MATARMHSYWSSDSSDCSFEVIEGHQEFTSNRSSNHERSSTRSGKTSLSKESWARRASFYDEQFGTPPRNTFVARTQKKEDKDSSQEIESQNILDSDFSSTTENDDSDVSGLNMEKSVNRLLGKCMESGVECSQHIEGMRQQLQDATSKVKANRRKTKDPQNANIRKPFMFEDATGADKSAGKPKEPLRPVWARWCGFEKAGQFIRDGWSSTSNKLIAGVVMGFVAAFFFLVACSFLFRSIHSEHTERLINILNQERTEKEMYRTLSEKQWERFVDTCRADVTELNVGLQKCNNNLADEKETNFELNENLKNALHREAACKAKLSAIEEEFEDFNNNNNSYDWAAWAKFILHIFSTFFNKSF